MITAIDTNVLLDILKPNLEWKDAAFRNLNFAAQAGSLCICDIVYAELCGHFETRGECDQFLKDLEILIDPMERDTLFLTSRIYQLYRKQGGQRNRILADFMIGAHAMSQAQCLLTRDRGFYQKLFPELKIMSLN